MSQKFDYQLYVSICKGSFTEWEAYRMSFIKPNEEESKEEVQTVQEEVQKTNEEDIKKDIRRRIKEFGVNPNPKATLEELQSKLLELNS